MLLDHELDIFEEELITPAHVKDLQMLELPDQNKHSNLETVFGEN